VNNGAEDYSENDQAFFGFDRTEGGTAMRGWGRLLQCLFGLALVGGVIYVWQSNRDGTDTSTAPAKDETKVPGVVVASSENGAGFEDAVYDESARRQLPQGDGPLAADAGGQGFGNQPEPFPSRDEAVGVSAPVNDLADGLDQSRSSRIPQSEPEPLGDPPQFDETAASTRGEQPAFPEENRVGFRPTGTGFSQPKAATTQSNSFGPGAETAGVAPAATFGGEPAIGNANPALPFSEPSDGARSRALAADPEVPVPDTTQPYRPRTLESTSSARRIAVEGQSTDALGVDRRTEGAAIGVHEVASGDSYWTISRRHYGTARYFQALAEYNRRRIGDPQRMKPGMKVLIPSRELLESQFATLVPRAGNSRAAATDSAGFSIGSDGHPVYRVGPDDTLTGIAEKYLGRTSRWIQIFRMNRSELPSPHKLKQGMVLRLPSDAARVQLAREADSRRY
jgi:nucleoid-associated protein YgaU